MLFVGSTFTVGMILAWIYSSFTVPAGAASLTASSEQSFFWTVVKILTSLDGVKEVAHVCQLYTAENWYTLDLELNMQNTHHSVQHANKPLKQTSSKQTTNNTNRYLVLLGHALCFLWLQAWAIPGTIAFNLLGGALFGMYIGYPLCLIYNTFGSCLLFSLSKFFGKRIVRRYGVGFGVLMLCRGFLCSETHGNIHTHKYKGQHTHTHAHPHHPQHTGEIHTLDIRQTHTHTNSHNTDSFKHDWTNFESLLRLMPKMTALSSFT